MAPELVTSLTAGTRGLSGGFEGLFAQSNSVFLDLSNSWLPSNQLAMFSDSLSHRTFSGALFLLS